MRTTHLFRAALLGLALAGPVLADGKGDSPPRITGTVPFSKPAGPAALLQQAQELTQKSKWAEGVPLWRQLADASPVNGNFWERLAWCLYQQKDYRQAIPAFARALELRAGGPANDAYNIACCHALLGEKEQALQWLEKALAIGFASLDHLRNDDDLKSLRSDSKYKELAGLPPRDKMSRVDGWRHDLKLLAREIKRVHFNPFRETSREEFDAYVRKLHDEIPNLKDAEVMIGLVRLARMAGDGHTFLRPAAPHPAIPLQLFHFQEGVFVTAAAPAHADLAGAQILKVGGHNTVDVLAALDPIIHRDNLMGVKALGAVLLRYPLALHGLGLIADADKVTLTVRDAAGHERDVTLNAVPAREDHLGGQVQKDWVTARRTAKAPEPLYPKNRTAPYWFEYRPDLKLVYCQYNAVRNDPKEPLAAFCERLFKFINEKDVQKLVLDLRWNGGGNSFLNRPLVHGLIRCDKVNQPGKLFVVIGRNPFSAAMNCTTDIEMHTNAIFVGEPTGSSPNFIGETNRLTLPYSKMSGSISNLYWGRSWPMDYRTWIAPQLYAPPSFALYKDNRDPALEAILDYASPGAAAAAVKNALPWASVKPAAKATPDADK